MHKQRKNFAWVVGSVFAGDLVIESKGCEKCPQRRKRKKRISDGLICADLEVKKSNSRNEGMVVSQWGHCGNVLAGAQATG